MVQTVVFEEAIGKDASASDQTRATKKTGELHYAIGWANQDPTDNVQNNEGDGQSEQHYARSLSF